MVKNDGWFSFLTVNSEFPKQIKLVLLHLSTTRNPIRNHVIFLLSVKSGFRAKEIASLRWKMVMSSDGQMMNEIHLTNTASKGKSSGRVITIHKELKKSFLILGRDYI